MTERISRCDLPLDAPVGQHVWRSRDPGTDTSMRSVAPAAEASRFLQTDRVPDSWQAEGRAPACPEAHPARGWGDVGRRWAAASSGLLCHKPPRIARGTGGRAAGQRVVHAEAAPVSPGAATGESAATVTRARPVEAERRFTTWMKCGTDRFEHTVTDEELTGVARDGLYSGAVEGVPIGCRGHGHDFPVPGVRPQCQADPACSRAMCDRPRFKPTGCRDIRDGAAVGAR